MAAIYKDAEGNVVCQLVHPPKHAGQFLRALFSSVYLPTEDGPYHGWPSYFRWETPVITITRHPSYFLRSAWAHQMRDNWKVGGTESHFWNTWTSLTWPMRSDSFRDFVFSIYPRHKGIVTWFQGLFTVPGMQLLRVGYLKADIAALGFDKVAANYEKVYNNHPNNRNQGTNIPEMDDDVKFLIERYEEDYFTLYGMQAYK